MIEIEYPISIKIDSKDSTGESRLFLLRGKGTSIGEAIYFEEDLNETKAKYG
jgi:hypothetical protein